LWIGAAGENTATFERAVRAAFKIQAAGALAQILHQAVERRLAQPAVGGRAFVGRTKLAEARIEFEISKVPNRHDNVWQVAAAGRI